MANFVFPANPEVGTPATLPNGRKMLYAGNNIWKLATQPLINDPNGPINNSQPPLEMDNPPALPSTNPFWYQKSTGKLHYQGPVGENGTQRAWIEI